MQTALRFGGMAGFLAAMVEWVAFLLGQALHPAAAALNWAAVALVLLLFMVAGAAGGRGQPLSLAGFSGGAAGLLYGLFTSVLPAVAGRGAVPLHVLSYVVLVLDALVFGLLFGWLGGLLGRALPRRSGP
jgi:hypothetical protein